jgi:hypothetical protein
MFERLMGSAARDHLLVLRGSKACQKIHNRLVNPQSTDRAGVVAETHYDVGNDLFERMLDPLMIYSCGELAK